MAEGEVVSAEWVAHRYDGKLWVAQCVPGTTIGKWRLLVGVMIDDRLCAGLLLFACGRILRDMWLMGRASMILR
jgi:hypothetical protein